MRLAAVHAVQPFLEGEIERRRALDYPPFGQLVRVEVAARAHGVSERALTALRDAAAPLLPEDRMLGPAPLFRVRNRERSQLLIKTAKPARTARILADLAARQSRALRKVDATIVIDVDPQ